MKQPNNKDITIQSDLGAGGSTSSNNNQNNNNEPTNVTLKGVVGTVLSDILAKGSSIIDKTQKLGEAIENSYISKNAKAMLKDAIGFLPSEIDDNVIDILDKVLIEKNKVEKKWGKAAANFLMNKSLAIQGSSTKIKNPKEWRTKVANNLKQAIKEINAKYANKFKRDSKQGNHPEWYTHYQEIVDRISTPNFALDRTQPIYTQDVDATVVLPTVISVDVHDPTYFGMGSDRQQSMEIAKAKYDALNKIIVTLNAFSTSGTSMLDDTTLGSYISNLNVIEAGIALLRMLISVTYWYPADNAALPKAIFKSYGYDYQDFKDNIAEITDRYNLLCVRFKSLATLPLDLFKRTRYLYGHIFKDSKQVKPPLIGFRPNWAISYCAVNGDDIRPGSSTNYLFGTNRLSPVTHDAMINYIDTVLDYMRTNLEFIKVSTLIRKAIGQSSVPTTIYAERKFNEKEFICNDINVIEQLHNATPTGQDAVPVVRQAFPIVSVNVHPRTAEQLASFGNTSYIDTKRNKLSRGDLMSIIRFKSVQLRQEGSTLVAEPNGGNEVIGKIMMVSPADLNLDQWDFVELTPGVSYVYNNIGVIITKAQQFDSMPYIDMSLVDTEGTNLGSTGIIYDFNNYGKASLPLLQTMQILAFKSLLWMSSSAPEVKKTVFTFN